MISLYVYFDHVGGIHLLVSMLDIKYLWLLIIHRSMLEAFQILLWTLKVHHMEVV